MSISYSCMHEAYFSEHCLQAASGRARAAGPRPPAARPAARPAPAPRTRPAAGTCRAPRTPWTSLHTARVTTRRDTLPPPTHTPRTHACPASAAARTAPRGARPPATAGRRARTPRTTPPTPPRSTPLWTHARQSPPAASRPLPSPATPLTQRQRHQHVAEVEDGLRVAQALAALGVQQQQRRQLLGALRPALAPRRQRRPAPPAARPARRARPWSPACTPRPSPTAGRLARTENEQRGVQRRGQQRANVHERHRRRRRVLRAQRQRQPRAAAAARPQHHPAALARSRRGPAGGEGRGGRGGAHSPLDDPVVHAVGERGEQRGGQRGRHEVRMRETHGQQARARAQCLPRARAQPPPRAVAHVAQRHARRQLGAQPACPHASHTRLHIVSKRLYTKTLHRYYIYKSKMVKKKYIP
ncbi:unnamed protein product [Chrysodeixis includens]|uniref:Uncharacterized protein n=1 Tax=Chrysodeixis includens TaxID=689277 RepID=A0A9P0BWP5_CHRIL|nr:unnamed protein product [Chrysodeixis includens]